MTQFKNPHVVDFNILLNKQIEKEQQERKNRERSGKFTPSSMGKCFRFQYWRREGQPESNPIPTGVFRTFRAGEIYHKDLQSLVKEEMTEVEYEDEDIKGFADHVTDNAVYDFKTKSSFGFKKLKKGYSIESDRPDYCYQVMTYCYLLGKDYGYIVFVNKDQYEIKMYELCMTDWKDRIELELSTLNRYWTDKALPPAKPRVKYGKTDECSCCVYRDKCKGVEDGVL